MECWLAQKKANKSTKYETGLVHSQVPVGSLNGVVSARPAQALVDWTCHFAGSRVGDWNWNYWWPKEDIPFHVISTDDCGLVEYCSMEEGPAVRSSS